jgi:hypothetical protein
VSLLTGKKWVLPWGTQASVRRKVIAEGAVVDADDDRAILEKATAAMPKRYDVDRIYEYRNVDVDDARTWMDYQFAQRGLFRYLPLVGRDCFTFAYNALQRAHIPVVLWQLYFQRGDGAIARLSPSSWLAKIWGR